MSTGILVEPNDGMFEPSCKLVITIPRSPAAMLVRLTEQEADDLFDALGEALGYTITEED